MNKRKKTMSEMSPESIRAARRIVREMLKVSQMGTSRGLQDLYMGMGLALGILFEECTGKKLKETKPIEVVKWARDLPDPQHKVVIVTQ
jgi:hypothetical protein